VTVAGEGGAQGAAHSEQKAGHALPRGHFLCSLSVHPILDVWLQGPQKDVQGTSHAQADGPDLLSTENTFTIQKEGGTEKDV
jgi:hypothetical protein